MYQYWYVIVIVCDVILERMREPLLGGSVSMHESFMHLRQMALRRAGRLQDGRGRGQLQPRQHRHDRLAL